MKEMEWPEKDSKRIWGLGQVLKDFLANQGTRGEDNNIWQYLLTVFFLLSFTHFVLFRKFKTMATSYILLSVFSFIILYSLIPLE
jgi:hypothetical protein